MNARLRLRRQLSRHRQDDEIFTSTIGLLLDIVWPRKVTTLLNPSLRLLKNILSFLSL